MNQNDLPTARVEPARRAGWVWALPALAGLMALILAWQAWGASGPRVSLRFAEGHGLRPGDSLRHRRIAVGQVEEVDLAPDLRGVRVTVRLDQNAAGLARAGSQFWIQRPLIGWTGVAGLDTLVGARYVAVLPGDGPEQWDFVGLDQPPLAQALEPGLNIVLEAPARHGLIPGSPITYRQIRVGTVLSAGLASDARTVEVHARVARAYTRLVRRDTRFWNVGGFDLSVGLTGLNLRLESIETLLVGSIALATPPDAGPEVATGHRFALHPEPDPDWLAWAPSVAIGHGLLPPGMPLPRPRRATLSWSEGRLFDSDEQREGWVLQVPGGWLGPADLLRSPPDAHPDSAQLAVAGQRVPLGAEGGRPIEGGLALLAADGPLDTWGLVQRRAPEEPEDCVLVADPNGTPLSLAAGRFRPRDGQWFVDPLFSLDASWHGACAVSRRDGSVVGLVLVQDGQARVTPVPEALP